MVKPLAVALTVYKPGGISWKANWPSVVVTLLCTMPVAFSVALTLALGTNAPDGSNTVPLMAPRKVCALALGP